MANMSSGPPWDLDRLLQHAGWARRLAASLANGNDADDLVQDTWLAALRSPPEAGLPARPWLKSVLLNLWHNRSREARRREPRDRAWQTGADEPASPEQIAIRFEAHRLLATAVSELPEVQRTVVLLRYYESRNAREIAEQLGVPAATVRGRLLAARGVLRERLSRSGDRDDWRRVLMPLVPAAARPGRVVVSVALAGALLAGAIAISVLVRSFGSRRERPPIDPESAAARPTTGATPTAVDPPPPTWRRVRDLPSFTTSGPRLAALDLPAALADCQQSNQTLRAEVAQGELEIWRYVGSQGRFERGGKPNPAAEAELRAVLPEALRSGRVESPPFTLECHTWDCRLRVLEKSETGARRSWVEPLKRGDSLSGRLRKVGFKGGPEYRQDPLSNTEVWEVIANLALADPSGKPMPRPGTPPLAIDRSPLPATIDGCQQQLTELQQRRHEQQSLLDGSQNPVLHFDRAQGARQPALEREVTGHLESVFGPAHQDIDVRCQGGVCRLRGPGVLKSRAGIDERLLGRLESRDRRHEVADEAAYFELEAAPGSSH
jgi:RNA polymerase sigma-70 factor (ECF subfamily)